VLCALVGDGAADATGTDDEYVSHVSPQERRFR
jgi:hypothetical protein